MAKPNPYRPFEPCEEQKALIPDVSGNDINGLGEEKKRRASYVYWNDPEKLAHGGMQRWFYQNDPENEALRQAREERARIIDMELPQIAAETPLRTASAWTELLMETAAGLFYHGFNPVIHRKGIADIKPSEQTDALKRMKKLFMAKIV